MVLEVCCTSVESAQAAEAAGANRIELCMFLASGGLTPSHGLISEVLNSVKIPVFVLIRNREGSFAYSENEKRAMHADIDHALDLGVQGIVAGALAKDGSLDIPFLEKVREQTQGVELTFHRAFDECKVPAVAATSLYQMGYDRILTSGQSLKAIDGLNVFSALMQLEQCPTILAGGGVTPENVSALIALGISEFHFSARMMKSGEIGRGIFDPGYETVDPQLVHEMKRVLNHASTPIEQSSPLREH
jgi:copper homeostasis protein